jgi:hypothetical protein
MWDGIFENIIPYLMIETKMSYGKPISYHKKVLLWHGELAMTNCTMKTSLSILESE